MVKYTKRSAADRFRQEANSLRRMGTEYRDAANSCDDPDLQRHHYDESSRYFSMAMELERKAEAISAALSFIFQ